MRRPTNITIVCIVILIIVAICVFAFNGNKKPNTNNVKNEVTQNSNSVVNNTVSENITNETENTVNEEQTQHEIENEDENALSSIEFFTETPRNEEEKAIGIAQNDWNGSDAAFSVTGMDANGNYIVQVTDSNTAVLAFYTVNVREGSFTKREMN